MNLSSKIKQFFAKLYFKVWPFPEHKPSGKPLNITGSKIVLFFNYSTEEEQILLTNQVPNLKKHLDTSSQITICNMSEIAMPNENKDVVFFSLNDYNLWSNPKQRLKSWFYSNEFDILISFVNDENVFCNNYVSSIKADFKAGIFNPENVKLFDLTIKQESDDISKQLELFTYYLNKLNINR